MNWAMKILEILLIDYPKVYETRMLYKSHSEKNQYTAIYSQPDYTFLFYIIILHAKKIPIETFFHELETRQYMQMPNYGKMHNFHYCLKMKETLV